MLPLLAGCAANPNALIFGTNTVLGLSAGNGTAGSPELTLGFRRQEAVLLPVVAANTWQDQGKLTFCQPEKISSGKPSGANTEGCLLMGSGANERDSLSVMASFGTKHNLKAEAISGEISQYFATGLAARRLAERSGPSAVATGAAAVVGGRLAGSAAMVEAVNSPEALAAARALVEADKSGREAVAANVEKAGDAGFVAYLGQLDAATSDDRFTMACKSLTKARECAEMIRSTSLLDLLDPEQWVVAKQIVPATMAPISSPVDEEKNGDNGNG